MGPPKKFRKYDSKGGSDRSSKKKKVEEDVTIDLVDDDNPESSGVPGAALQDAEKNDQVPEDEFGAKDYRFFSAVLSTLRILNSYVSGNETVEHNKN